MSHGKIFVAGSLHYDIIVEAPHLPARDETVVGGPMRFVCGGKGGNQAAAASRHGADVAFAGMVGSDRFGDELVVNLRDVGVDVTQVERTASAASGASVAIVERGGEYGAVIASGANLAVDPGRVDLPGETALLVLQNEVPEAVNIALAQRAHLAGTKVVLNAAPWRPSDQRMLENTDILVVNRVEAEGLLGKPIASSKQAAEALEQGSFPGLILVITLGAQGLVFREENQSPGFMPAYDIKVNSTHGAGDTFVGAMCSALARDCSVQSSLQYASAAAALHVSTPVEERAMIDRRQTETFMASARLRASAPST